MKISNTVTSDRWQVTSMGRAEHPVTRHPSPVTCAAFTMIEIALCLAIIGFALVAIIGVLPTGLNVQKDNREETIINQDAISWMNSIRNGAQGYDDLTNYVIAITNSWAVYNVTASLTNKVLKGNDGYTFNGSLVTSVVGPPGVPNTYHLNGTNIIGLLSTPKYISLPPPSPGTEAFQSNYFVAYVRAFSGSAVEKSPQANQTVLEGAFTYKLIVENIPYVPVDPGATNYALLPAGSARQLASSNYLHVVQTLMTNSHDLRLTFRWPYFPDRNDVGNNRVTFRAFTGGWLFPTKDFYVPAQPLYFFQSSTYVR